MSERGGQHLYLVIGFQSFGKHPAMDLRAAENSLSVPESGECNLFLHTYWSSSNSRSHSAPMARGSYRRAAARFSRLFFSCHAESSSACPSWSAYSRRSNGGTTIPHARFLYVFLSDRVYYFTKFSDNDLPFVMILDVSWAFFRHGLP